MLEGHAERLRQLGSGSVCAVNGGHFLQAYVVPLCVLGQRKEEIESKNLTVVLKSLSIQRLLDFEIKLWSLTLVSCPPLHDFCTDAGKFL